MSLPLIASGAIATPQALAGVLATGAVAAQIGTAFTLAPEAATSLAHRNAIRRRRADAADTRVHGAAGEGDPQLLHHEHGAGAPVAYLELHYLTSPMRRDARKRGDAGLTNLWAGEAHGLARARPAAETVRWLAN